MRNQSFYDYTNYIRTGSGDDKFYYLSKTQLIIDLGAGDNEYRVENSLEGVYIYNFNDGDKIYFLTTRTTLNNGATTKENHFKDYVFDSYATKNAVVARTDSKSRIIYITGTGELYHDEGGDAVYKEADTSIDLKNGSKDKRMAKIYSSAYKPGDKAEDNGTPATFTTDSFEIVDWPAP